LRICTNIDIALQGGSAGQVGLCNKMRICNRVKNTRILICGVGGGGYNMRRRSGLC